MAILSAQNSFKKGLAALVDDVPAVAIGYFREAMCIEEQRSMRPTMRYLSYYGYCLARTAHPQGAAARACETAAETEPRDADLLLNLGRVYMLAGRTRAARRIFDRALRISPGNRVLQRERARAELRLSGIHRTSLTVRSRNLAVRVMAAFRPSTAVF
jgi:Flp pilus assembly protein TadD